MFGYHGRYLKVDLSTGSSEYLPLPEEVLRRFIGGVGLGAYLLYQESPAGVDPLASEAPLVFCLSPLVGTPLTTSAKFAVVAKSPLTQRLNDALSSSHFALAAKRAGFDALVIVGACSKPSLLVIRENQIQLRPAEDLWGLSAQEAGEKITTRLGPEYSTAIIGLAGENLVRYATISHENRHAGRGGLGAVMGSKKLKAIAVSGTQRVEVADPAGVIASAKELSRQSFGPATAKYRELGTVANLLTFNRFAALPTRNFQQGTFEQAAALSGEELNQARRVARNSCAACTIGCEHIYETPSPLYEAPSPPTPLPQGARGEKSPPSPPGVKGLPLPPSPLGGEGSGVRGKGVRLEYESLFALGPLCGIGDKDVVLRAAQLCDHFGLDTISTGASIAFAMECAERGLIQEPGLRFGNSDATLELIEKIARREGLGQLLAEGTRLAAQTIGGPTPDFAPHVKGLEIPGYEPRALQTMALGFAVGSRGADHNRSGAYEVDFSSRADRLHGTPEAARLAIETEDRAALMDSLILCKFLRGVFTNLFAESATLLRQVTGWDVNEEDLQETAQRIITLKKLYNLREGWTASEDTLPKRFLSEGIPSGKNSEAHLPEERLRAMIQAYYRTRGWSEAGLVPSSQVEALGLQNLLNT